MSPLIKGAGGGEDSTLSVPAVSLTSHYTFIHHQLTTPRGVAPRGEAQPETEGSPRIPTRAGDGAGPGCAQAGGEDPHSRRDADRSGGTGGQLRPREAPLTLRGSFSGRQNFFFFFFFFSFPP